MANKTQLAISTEYVPCPVTSPLTQTELTALTVQMVFVSPDTDPDTITGWLTASWTVIGNVAYAQTLVGPSGGTVTLAKGTYAIYAKIVSSPETPIIQSPGFLVIE